MTLAAGILAGTGWAFLGRILPGIAVALAAATALVWWWTKRRPAHAADCAGGTCSCEPTGPVEAAAVRPYAASRDGQ